MGAIAEYLATAVSILSLAFEECGKIKRNDTFVGTLLLFNDIQIYD